jgi:curli production assembly/transport component CsgG
VPIERENIGNLLQERNLIRSTRQVYKDADPSVPQITPLLYAGILLEGGIVSYDSNIITGGFGARYFVQGELSRQDRVTIYLRMVSTSNGKILKSVYFKTILSQAIDQSLFKYVSLKDWKLKLVIRLMNLFKWQLEAIESSFNFSFRRN